MTARTRHVEGSTLGHRPLVRLTRELPMGRYDSFPHFIGDLDGTPIDYHCLDVIHAMAIRRGLSEGHPVTTYVSPAWLRLARPDEALRADIASLNELARAELA